MRVLRVAVVGAGGVGKSAITVRFINGQYIEMYDPTIEDSYRKQFNVDGAPCLLEILDTAGIDQYLSLNDLFIRDSDGFVLVFSVTQKETYDELLSTRENIERIKAPLGLKHVPMVIVGNKADLTETRLSPTLGQELAATAQCPYVETSARTNQNTELVFAEIVRQLRQFPPEPRLFAAARKRRGRKKCVIL